MSKPYKTRCKHCVCLVEVKKQWHCDELDMPCKYVEDCPYENEKQGYER